MFELAMLQDQASHNYHSTPSQCTKDQTFQLHQQNCVQTYAEKVTVPKKRHFNKNGRAIKSSVTTRSVYKTADSDAIPV